MDLVLAEYSFVAGVLWPQWLSRWRKMGEVRGFRIWTHLLKGANRVMAWCWKYTFWNIVCIRFQSISIKGNHWIISWGALRSHSILILTIAVILGSRRSYHRRLRINKCSNISYCASFRRFHIGGQKKTKKVSSPNHEDCVDCLSFYLSYVFHSFNFSHRISYYVLCTNYEKVARRAPFLWPYNEE